MDIAGLNISRSPESGKLLQPGLKDGIVEIILIADEGYFFPDDYASGFDPATLNGLSIAIKDNNTLSISGKPTESTCISLVPAVSKLFAFSEKPEPDEAFERHEDLVLEKGGIEDDGRVGGHDDPDESNRTLIFLPDENNDVGDSGHLLDLDGDTGNSYGQTSSHFNPDDDEEYIVIETYEATAMLEDDDESAEDEKGESPEIPLEPDSRECKSEKTNRPGSLRYLGMTIISVAVVSYWKLKRRKK